MAVPLDNFGTASFSSGMTTKNGNSETIAASGVQAITMVNNADQTLATPSSLGADGASFTVTRTAAVAETSFGGSAQGGAGSFGPGGLGRGWRRTGVGVQGYQPHSRSSLAGTPAVVGTTTGVPTGTTGRSGRFGFNGGFSQIFWQLQQLEQLRQQIQLRGTYRL